MKFALVVEENRKLIEENQQLKKRLEETLRNRVSIEDLKNELSQAAEKDKIFSNKDMDYVCANSELITSSMYSNCPKLMKLLETLTSNPTVSKSIFSQILFCFSQRANALCFLLGFYLIGTGAGKKLLSVTHKLGLTPHYSTLWDFLKTRKSTQQLKLEELFRTQQGNFIIDNINMSNPPRFFRSVKTIQDQWNGTAALVFFTPIEKLNFKNDHELFLTKENITKLFHFYSQVFQNLSNRRTGIGKAVDKMKLYSLPLIDENCGTTDGCRKVLLELLKLSKEKESVVFGDVGFIQTARGAKREVQSEEGLTNLKTLSLVYGDFHAFMEEQTIIKKSFWGKKDEFFSLSFICNLLKRDIQENKKQFHHTDELFLHILIALKRFFSEYSSEELVHKFHKQQDYLSCLGWNLLNYWGYRAAVRAQDINILSLILKNQFFRYLGSGCCNYTTQTKYLLFDELPPNSFLFRSLNLIGVENHGKAVDLVMEHYIGYIKNTLKLSNTKIDKLQVVTSNVDLLESSEEVLNNIFGIRYNRSYSAPNFEEDINRILECLRNQNGQQFPSIKNIEEKGVKAYFSYLCK